MSRGYAWDGCSPKYACCDIIIGTPDGVVSERTGLPKTYFASLVHDLIYQFQGLDGMPFTRRDADDIFLFLLNQEEFGPASLYYAAVRAFGWFFMNTRARRDPRHQELLKLNRRHRAQSLATRVGAL